jgi:DNA-directed RNA polymerase I, II, and III subunit RPABC1
VRQDYAQRMKDDNVSRAIIVVQAHLTPFARQSLLETERSKYHIEQFHEQELLVNITQHVLVPEHQLLSGARPAAAAASRAAGRLTCVARRSAPAPADDEKRQLLERYKVKEGQLPRIQTHDPVARFYGLKRGNVVRILRPSETAGRYVTYRLCV